MANKKNPDVKVATRIVEIPIRVPKSKEELYGIYIANIGLRKAIGEAITAVSLIEYNGTDTGESRQMRSSRVGSNYLNNAITEIARLQNLSGGAYALTDKQVETIIGELTNAVSKVANSLNSIKANTPKVTL